MSHSYGRISSSWRHQRGRTSKISRHEKGKIQVPRVGFGAKKSDKFLHPSGFQEVLVKNVNDLQNLDAKTSAAKISATVGRRKREDIVKKASELKIKVLNPGVVKK